MDWSQVTVVTLTLLFLGYLFNRFANQTDKLKMQRRKAELAMEKAIADGEKGKIETATNAYYFAHISLIRLGYQSYSVLTTIALVLSVILLKILSNQGK